MTDNEKRQAYYCSREWGLKREAVRQRSGGTCERCTRNPAAAVHHKTYARLYDEPLTDLWHLCDKCHDYVHGRSNVDPAEIVLSVYLAGAVFRNDRGDVSQMHEEHDNTERGNDDEGYEDDDGILVYDSPRISDYGYSEAIDDWRSDIFPDVYHTQHKASSTANASPLKYHNLKLIYGGPTITLVHGCDACRELPTKCLAEVRRSNLLFAWVASTDTIGTLVEVGAAHAFCVPVFVAFKSEELKRHFYFIDRLSHSVVTTSAADAWQQFLALVADRMGQRVS